ncbi:hypothetical protein CERSUDRAFT_149434 [Gelatoporia subvermispora B]|uniref:Uncharacterized protein n=1 Tax=Ceriporiopsis subvermispora (strain B) TaxID=914234 RepID=M2PVU9_CERS8|nr:hypothetical protein CERSUDRAFT_149434 [Gelatoporia subvermispora B]
MAPKRKVSELDGSDDDEPSLGRQVLPVANLPADFNGEPLDGMQYLFMVRRDARTLPHVIRVANPYELQYEPIVAVAEASMSQSNQSFLPSEEWRDKFLKRFRNFRKNAVQPTLDVQRPCQRGKVLPDKREREYWWAFLAGRPHAEWDPPKKPRPNKLDKWQKQAQYSRGMRSFSPEQSVASLDYDEQPESERHEETWQLNGDGEVELATTATAQSLPTPGDIPAYQETQIASVNAGPAGESEVDFAKPKPREPTPFLMQNIDHRYALHLLMYFTYWMNIQLESRGLPFTQLTLTHARWIFALLAHVDDYLSGDEMSLLRSLARACMSLLKDCSCTPKHEGDSVASDGPMDTASCWMIITAVIGVWGQRDLWMDAEAMLTQ